MNRVQVTVRRCGWIPHREMSCVLAVLQPWSEGKTAELPFSLLAGTAAGSSGGGCERPRTRAGMETVTFMFIGHKNTIVPVVST